MNIQTGYDVCPFNIKQGTVNLTLVGDDNVLQAGLGKAALQVSEDSELVITEKSTGTLTARGGGESAGSGAKGTISGGTIACKSITSTLTISGGSVRTDDNSVIKGMAVVKVPHANAKVALIKIGEDSSYGSKDVYTDGEGKLYLYKENSISIW